MSFGSLSAVICRSLLLTGCLFCLLQVGSAQVMSSDSYQIESDSINVGGGFSSSTSYSLESTTGEIATGHGTSSNYALFAGYQQMQDVYLSLSDVADVVMSPTLAGLSGGTANGSTSVHVLTDSRAGYQVTIEAASSPAMQSDSGSISDYVPAGEDPDFAFVSDANSNRFGFSPEGPDIALRYQDNGDMCGVAGGDTPDRCWDGLATTPTVIVSAPGANHPDGATTTIQFRIEVGGNDPLMAGEYVATTTITALAL